MQPIITVVQRGEKSPIASLGRVRRLLSVLMLLISCLMNCVSNFIASLRKLWGKKSGVAATTLWLALSCQLCLFVKAAQAQTGQKIYRERCVECHGESGEGVQGEYDNRLQGVLTPYELENYISKSMPEGNEDACVGDEAKEVAKYIFEEFYSLKAQNRRNPPRYLFSRLTTDQFRNSVVDILSAFTKRKEIRPKEFGLQGIYYASRSMKKEKKVDERIDGSIDFDFGEGSPDKVDSKEFSIRWLGSLIAEETGAYEIIVESANSVRLRLNSDRSSLVDANVISGDRAEYRATVHLLQNRLYNLSIDVTRFKEKQGFVRISWVRPNGVREVIPATNYCTSRTSPLATLATNFPADDESYGYPRGISVSRQWTSSVANAAMEVGQLVTRYFDVFVPPNPNATQRRKAAQEFCYRFAKLAFRGDLTDEQKRIYVDKHFEDSQVEIREATKRCLVLILKSPRFLYLDLIEQQNPARKQDSPAFTLARVFWDSVPHAELLKAEQSNQLIDRASINSLLNNMLADRRSETKLENFFRHYFKLDDLHNLEKDDQLFKDFDSALANDLKRSIRIQINQMVWEQNASLEDLLLTNELYASPRMIKFYGLDTDENNDRSYGEFIRVSTDQWSGILSHPLLMSGFAYNRGSSPIHRGVFVARSIIGRRLSPPPDTFPPFDGEVAKSWTTREKVSFQTKPDSCQRCHGLINNLGFAFEAFDAVGKPRAKDNEKPVSTKGQYRTFDGKMIQFEGAADLAEFLAQSENVRRHFVSELFQFMVKQPLSVYGPNASQRLMNHFRDSRYKIRSLVIEIGKVAAFTPPNR